MAITNSLNPNVVKTYLDGLFYPEWNLLENPHIAQAEDAYVFNQMVSDKAQEAMEEFKGVGEWELKSELGNPVEGQPMSVYTQFFLNYEYAKGVEIAGRFWDDDQHNMIEMVMRDFATKGKASKNKDAFSVYRNGFTTTYGDGVALFASTHPITGGTQSNTGTAKLAESTLNTGIVNLAEQKDRDGVQLGRMPHCLLVSTANFKRACTILESELRSGTANNDKNVYSDKYGIFLKATLYIGTTAGGSDDYWFLLAKNNPVVRFLRKDVTTTLIDRNVARNDAYYYRGSFRQSVGPISYVGAYGNSGTTGSYDA